MKTEGTIQHFKNIVKNNLDLQYYMPTILLR